MRLARLRYAIETNFPSIPGLKARAFAENYRGVYASSSALLTGAVHLLDIFVASHKTTSKGLAKHCFSHRALGRPACRQKRRRIGATIHPLPEGEGRSRRPTSKNSGNFGGKNIHGMDLPDLRRSKVSGKPVPARSKGRSRQGGISCFIDKSAIIWLYYCGSGAT